MCHTCQIANPPSGWPVKKKVLGFDTSQDSASCLQLCDLKGSGCMTGPWRFRTDLSTSNARMWRRLSPCLACLRPNAKPSQISLWQTGTTVGFAHPSNGGLHVSTKTMAASICWFEADSLTHEASEAKGFSVNPLTIRCLIKVQQLKKSNTRTWSEPRCMDKNTECTHLPKGSRNRRFTFWHLHEKWIPKRENQKVKGRFALNN